MGCPQLSNFILQLIPSTDSGPPGPTASTPGPIPGGIKTQSCSGPGSKKNVNVNLYGKSHIDSHAYVRNVNVSNYEKSHMLI